MNSRADVIMQEDNWTQRTVEANGQRIHLTIAGSDGPLVLFCHGFPESWYSWRSQLRALSAAGYRAVAMDMLGYGRSSKPSDSNAYRITELVEVSVGVVQALGEKQAVIVGHDLGAPVAWTSAWTRPDIFRAVVGLSLPFGARGLACLPGSPFGELRPADASQQLAGPDMMFYHEYFSLPGGVAAAEAEKDIRTWLMSTFYTLSANRPLPVELQGIDLTTLPADALRSLVRAAMAMPRGGALQSVLEMPAVLPPWLSQEDLDYCVAQFEHGGLQAPLNYYRNAELDWEILGQYQGQPLGVPSLFIGGDRDIVTIWSQEAIARARHVASDFRGAIIIPDCGHWIPQEKPDAVNTALLDFLQNL